MHPVYRWIDSYPHHANPTHYAPNDDPRAKEISSHMKMDPSTLSSPYQPWPYGGNYCYPGPQECHGGYGHGCFGGPYSFRPPYPYYPPPPFHAHGLYPPFPGAYPAYSVPPPHYSVEQPRYDYDKYGSHHGCGCNHREDEKKSKIEREEPQIEKKTSDSLIPSLLKDYPYPIMYVPPGFVNTESKVKEKEKYSHDPVPLEPLEPSKQGENGETDQDQQDGDGKRLPFPIFWFPSKNNEVGDKNLDLVADKGSPFSRSEAKSEMGSKPAVQKVIPVEQLGTEEEKKSLKSIETKVKPSTEDKADNGMEGKASPKTPKLPPVCLRIDPLPRKKNSSRSPSPPGDKGRSKGTPVDKSKSSQQQTQLSEGLKKSKEEQSEGNIKTIKVMNGDANQVGRENVADPCENVPKGIVSKAQKLSENEAALIIQSACRGFQVRKSKPITKLRQIAEVGKKVIELRTHIQDLESSSSGICFDDKQKLVIGETIMSLLLKLDTIQGLHPVVRDVRKSVTKELVGLQEKLDSLTSVKSETPIESRTERVMHPEDDAIQEKSDQGQTQLDGNVKLVVSATNREVEPTESGKDGDAEAHNTNLEPQMELQNEESTIELDNNQVQVLVETKQPLDDVIQDKLGQSSEIGATDCVDMKVDDMKAEQKLEEQSSGEAMENQPRMPVKTEQPADNAIQEKLADHPRAESGTSLVQAVESDTCVCEHIEEDGVKCDDNGGSEAADINLQLHSREDVTSNQLEVFEREQPPVEQDKRDQLETQFGKSVEDAGGHYKIEAKKSLQVGDGRREESGGGVVDNEEKDVRMVDRQEVKAEQDSVNGTREDLGPTVDDLEEDLPTGSLVVRGGDREVVEEKERLRGSMEELMKEQMVVIRELTGRVKDLEKKLSKTKSKKKKKMKGRRSHGCVVQEELN